MARVLPDNCACGTVWEDLGWTLGHENNTWSLGDGGLDGSYRPFEGCGSHITGSPLSISANFHEERKNFGVSSLRLLLCTPKVDKH